MEEQWKDIIGYEGKYQISNYGNVKSLNYHRSRKEQIMKQRKDKYGYMRVGLRKNRKYYLKQIHRLVALHFIPNDDIFKTQINHKDECKTNNFVFVNEDGSIDESKSNLEWCDVAYNNNYGTHQQRSAKTRSKQVQQYSKDGKTLIKTFPSTREVARELGFDNGHICECCLGKRKTSNGFIWKYKNDDE